MMDETLCFEEVCEVAKPASEQQSVQLLIKSVLSKRIVPDMAAFLCRICEYHCAAKRYMRVAWETAVCCSEKPNRAIRPVSGFEEEWSEDSLNIYIYTVRTWSQSCFLHGFKACLVLTGTLAEVWLMKWSLNQDTTARDQRSTYHSGSIRMFSSIRLHGVILTFSILQFSVAQNGCWHLFDPFWRPWQAWNSYVPTCCRVWFKQVQRSRSATVLAAWMKPEWVNYFDLFDFFSDQLVIRHHGTSEYKQKMEGNWKTLSAQKLRNVKTIKITTKDVRAALQ